VQVKKYKIQAYRYRAGWMNPTPTIDRGDTDKYNTPTLILPPQGGGKYRVL